MRCSPAFHALFRLTICAALLGAVGLPGHAQQQVAGSSFNEEFLGIGGDQPHADLSLFSFGNRVLAGKYMVDVSLNERGAGQTEIRFDEKDVRAMGRAARGVRGMALEPSQSVIAMLVADDESQSVLTATENGYGKRTSIVEYTRHGRGTKGMIAIQQSERNGKVVAATLVRPDDEIMLITDSGVLVRTRVAEIRELGRATQGVTLIALDDGARLTGLQRIVENDASLDAAIADAGSDSAPSDGDGP